MTDKTLFLAWQDKRLTREWFPVGRLDVLADKEAYRFRYIKGAERARDRAGFDALMDFPEWGRTYESSVLFPLFMKSMLSPRRLVGTSLEWSESTLPLRRRSNVFWWSWAVAGRTMSP